MKKKLILIRGAQGSGKSTLASLYARRPCQVRWVEADMFFTSKNGHYNFDPQKLPEAHDWCYKQAVDGLNDQECDLVIVSNTFVDPEHMKPYINVARSLGIPVEVIVCFGEYRNEHGVPKSVVERTRNSMVPYPGEFIYATDHRPCHDLLIRYPRYRNAKIQYPSDSLATGINAFPHVEAYNEWLPSLQYRKKVRHV